MKNTLRKLFDKHFESLVNGSRKFVCKVTDHKFKTFADGLKRRCECCGREDWVFGNPYPLIGQPKYEWKTMWDEGKL